METAGGGILNGDYDTNMPGVQVISTNAGITLNLKAPLGGTVGHVSLASVAGDAYGSAAINLEDEAAPSVPAGLSVTAGQSRIWVSWQTNSEPDVTSYRVRYQAEAAGPEWNGPAAVEGSPSPVSVIGTNWLLRGLALGTNYFVTVSAVDSTGHESPLATAVSVTTTQAPPSPPTAVARRAGADGTNVLMWALSEDDGHNDRDVVRYDIYRVILPDDSSNKVAEVAAGLSICSDTNPAVGSTQYIGYVVVAIDNAGLSSAPANGNRVLASGSGVDNDGDGIADDWETLYGLNPQNPADALADADGDGLTNLQEYELGLNPVAADRPYVSAAGWATNGAFAVSLEALYGRNATLEVSTNLADWETLTNFTSPAVTIYFEDMAATNAAQRYYRVVLP